MSEEVDPELVALKEKIFRERGFHCHLYKDKCLRRRLGVRMRARGYESFAAYASLLDRDALEYDRLIDTLTINVTKFFRNPETWSAVESRVIPEIMAEEGEIRIWSAGCASGEEPYSISILAHEWAETAERLDVLERLRILGTDIDRGSLVAASRAEYEAIAFEDTLPERQARWFHTGPRYRLKEEARRSVEFARADLISDPLPEEQSLIVCRNVIIYFDRAVQEQLFDAFVRALRPGGFLVLGRVETLFGPIRTQLRSVSPKERIYMKPL